jgi:hypothetical protein
MLKQLTPKNAIIQTATVEIKTLTLSGKQVTLAVYRQLPECDILDVDWDKELKPIITMNGTPWGLVNYCLPGCPKEQHLHVVWQDGDTLYRSTTRNFYNSDVDIEREESPEQKRVLRKENEEWRKLYYRLNQLPQLFIAV